LLQKVTSWGTITFDTILLKNRCLETRTWQDLRQCFVNSIYLRESYNVVDHAIGDLIYSLKPQYYEKGILPRGNTSLKTVVRSLYDTDKSKTILGLEYRGYAEVINDVFADFEARGWLSEHASLK
jgi:hypothetical protein